VAQDSGHGQLDQIRHQYERINLQDVCHTVTDDLPPLKAAVIRALTPRL
jgi:uncharacterized protein with HEPN domain